MDTDRIERISRRAYELWEEGGRRDGSADEDWRRAEQEDEARSGSGAAAADRGGAGETGSPKRPPRARPPGRSAEGAELPPKTPATSSGRKPGGGKPRTGRAS